MFLYKLSRLILYKLYTVILLRKKKSKPVPPSETVAHKLEVLTFLYPQICQISLFFSLSSCLIITKI